MSDEPNVPGNDASEDNRSATRLGVLKRAKIVFGQSSLDCMVIDESETGIRVRTDVMAPIPERVTLRLGGGVVFSAVKRWARGMEIGFSFEGPPSLDEESAAIAWRAYEMARAASVEETIRLLGASRFFDDLALRNAAEKAEAALRGLEQALAARARRPDR